MTDNLIYFRFILIALLSVFMLQFNSAQASDWIYTTVKGDSLWNLSEKHLDKVTRYAQLKKINGIKAPRIMQPGTQIRIPMKWIRSNSVPAEIVSVEGSAELFQVNGNVIQESLPGTLIYLGDRLKSGHDSSVAVKFADNSILTLHSDSVIRFDHLTAHGVTGMVDSRLHLLEGRMDTRVIPAKGPGSRFEIKTPSAISAVRGTEYRASVETELQSSNIEVLKGKVAVSGAQKKQLIKAGYGTQVAAGKAPLPPQKLLAAPKLNVIDETIRNIQSIISWEPVEGALQYRIELASENHFNTILWQQSGSHIRAALPDLPDARYFIRVRAVDKLGLEGNSTVQTILIDARPQPPIQLKPAEGDVLRGKIPKLQWTGSSEANTYRLEIASDGDFNQLLLKQDGINETHFSPSELSETGQYFWRLTSIATNGEIGPVGTTRSYEIKPIPDKVDPEMKTADDGQFVATWHSGGPELTYQVQLAYNKEFSDLEFDKMTDKPEISFAPVSGQVRYLRVRAIESDGYQGPWGASQQVAPLPDETLWLIPALGVFGFILLL
ncbi:MAG: FecR domain-containing protein [Gammaproteobacteria bacterium]|nr:FecR domain-containing protein [Gammaproteobacteria bacterium]